MSTSITLFNRAVFSVYHFNYPSFVTLVQILVSIVYMYALKWGGWMELGSLSLDTAKRVSDVFYQLGPTCLLLRVAGSARGGGTAESGLLPATQRCLMPTGSAG